MAFVDNPLDVFFDLVPTGAALYSPLYDARGELVDFRFVRLNPAGQRLLGLPAQPPRTFREYYPSSVPTGIFAQYHTAYLTGETSTYDVPYAGDGIDTYFRLVAQRSGELLVVNFTDMGDLPHSAVEQSLRESRAREQTARAEAEAQRQRLHDILLQLPAQVATNRGPDHVYDLVNPRYQQQFPARVLRGLPVREALPELAGQQFFELLDQVYQTGEPFYGSEMPALVDYTHSGRMEKRYFDVFFQALRNADGQIDGILNFAYDVSEQVRAREQQQHLNQELAQTNEELRATTDEYQVANLALSEAQHQLQQLNQELEARVHARTQDVLQAQAETETQRQRLAQLVAEAPALIATLRGPEHVVELANDNFRAIFGGREMVGKPYRQAVPELAGQPFFALLDQVYRTGETSYGLEQPVTLDRTNSGRLEDLYITYIHQATRDAQGQIDGILIFATDVTDQMLARQEREAWQRQFYAFFEQAPFGLCIFGGPDLVYEFFNPSYQRLLPNRDLVGRPLLEVMPELAGTQAQ
ncbi:PAS domain-containing protein [Hymenobacter terrenus]|uniref:PAS domain-containing protein n=1 Tax=Hymenobacter terrenus TaxID=1629124 RepID=UPI000619DF1D|nr:PAS domain-containing protein [Hymenobacter terrenus]